MSEVPTSPPPDVPHEEVRLSPAFPARLATALAKAQRAMAVAEKDRVATVTAKDGRGSYRYTYATLAAVWDAIREPLGANGLALVQFPRVLDTAVAVRTVLAHESGEYVEETLELPIALKTPQGIGSIITYARRYGICSIVGVASDDDDGAGVSPADGLPVSAPPPRASPPRSVRAPQATPESIMDVRLIESGIDSARSLDELAKWLEACSAVREGPERDSLRSRYKLKKADLQAKGGAQ